MLSKMRNRYGVIGPVAILALIVAVAFAGVPAVAQPVANSSANLFGLVKRALKLGGIANKRSVNAIKFSRAALKKAGVPGPAGPTGPKGDKGSDGAKGADGDNGTPGTNGTDGADGNSVLNGVGVPSDALGVDGDFYIDTDSQEMYGPKAGGSWPLPGTALKGEDGEPWTAGGTLPPGETLAGVWAIYATVDGSPPDPGLGGLRFTRFAAPFGIPAAAAPTSHLIDDSGNEVGGANDGNPQAACSGDADDPQADSGHLCVYLESTGVSTLPNISSPIPPGVTPVGGAGTSTETVGFEITGVVTGDVRIGGSWAVTG